MNTKITAQPEQGNVKPEPGPSDSGCWKGPLRQLQRCNNLRKQGWCGYFFSSFVLLQWKGVEKLLTCVHSHLGPVMIPLEPVPMDFSHSLAKVSLLTTNTE